MAIKLQKGERDLGRIVDSINEIIEGRQNSVGDVTLTPGATSTIVSFPNCSKACRVFLFPQTAAAVLTQVRIGPSDIRQGSFTIIHSVAAAGASFSFLCIGG